MHIRIVYNLVKQFWSGFNFDYFTISMHVPRISTVSVSWSDSRAPVPGLCPSLPFASCCGLYILNKSVFSFSVWTVVGLPHPAIVFELQLTPCIRKNNLSSKKQKQIWSKQPPPSYKQTCTHIHELFNPVSCVQLRFQLQVAPSQATKSTFLTFPLLFFMKLPQVTAESLIKTLRNIYICICVTAHVSLQTAGEV